MLTNGQNVVNWVDRTRTYYFTQDIEIEYPLIYHFYIFIYFIFYFLKYFIILL
jgi:hypothetical protein